MKVHCDQLIFNGENTAVLTSQEQRFSGELFHRNNSNFLKKLCPAAKLITLRNNPHDMGRVFTQVKFSRMF